jgi:hypothetical protein
MGHQTTHNHPYKMLSLRQITCAFPVSKDIAQYLLVSIITNTNMLQQVSCTANTGPISDNWSDDGASLLRVAWGGGV